MGKDIVATIFELEREGREATLANDAGVWERLLADDWVTINADGSVTTKAQLLALLRTQPFSFVSIADDDVLVRPYPGAVIVTGRSTRTLAGRDQQAITRVVRFTRLYIQHGERWKIAAAQATPLA